MPPLFHLQIDMKITIIIRQQFVLSNLIEMNGYIEPVALEYIMRHKFNSIAYYSKKVICNKSIELEKILPIHSDGSAKEGNDFFSLIDNASFLFKGENQIKQLQHHFKGDSIKFTLIYLICMHEEPSQLKKMVETMADSKEIAFIVFVDGKVDLTKYEVELNKDSFFEKNNIFFVAPRIPIIWSHISQVLSQLILLQAALKYFPDSLYYSMHSGSDYQLVPTEYILNFLKINHPMNFIRAIPLESSSESKKMRLKRAVFFINETYSLDFIKKNPHLYIFNIDENLTKAVNTMVPNRFIKNRKYGTGSNWFTITSLAAAKMMNRLHNDSDLLGLMDYVMSADEIIFQTLFYESNLKTVNEYLRYIDWSTNSMNPRVLLTDHFEKIVENPCCFWARKIRLRQSSTLYNKIDERIKNLRKLSNFSKCNLSTNMMKRYTNEP